MNRYYFLFVLFYSCLFIKAQSKEMPTSYVDFYMGIDLNCRDMYFNGRVYDILINLTPSVKWYIGKGWQASAQALVPVINQYGDRYKKIRVNMAVLSKEMNFNSRWFLKMSGGLFGMERYGVDTKTMYVANKWFALELQTSLTGYCSMAVGWEASMFKRWIALGGMNFYLYQYNTQFRVRGGRFVYEDYGVIIDVMRHFKHCTVGVYAQYSDKGGKDGGFKITVMIPPYKRTCRKVNFRPASNFRYVYTVHGDTYANKVYKTDPEENEREGWFDRKELQWGSSRMKPDFMLEMK